MDIFSIDFSSSFLERKWEGGRRGEEREKHQPERHINCLPGNEPATKVHDWESNPLPFGPWADVQTTEPNQPGP